VLQRLHSTILPSGFFLMQGSIYLVVDGWTAPFACSYLGIVVVWFAQGQIWQATLEFIW